jgi:Amiloride-sensitive sodium channel
MSFPGEIGEKICGGMEIDCAANATLLHQVSEASEELETSVGGKIGTSKCNCLPTCSHIEYEVSTTQAYFDWRSLFNAFKNPMDEFEP